MALFKSHGTTRTERLLSELCDQSFLKLWSYANPFKDDGKEFCDLLVVFENYVFIFFDRESQRLSNLDKDPLVAWTRWKKDVIDSQARSAQGAERYLRSGRPLFLDKGLENPFPLDIRIEGMTVHKIIVAHGAEEACKNWSSQNVYGSLAIAYGGISDLNDQPFFVQLDKSDPIHVLDSHNLPIIFNELDTISDFASFFDEKTRAINFFDTLSYCGEEDLLAHYFANYDETTKSHYIGTKRPGVGGIHIGEGEWQDFINLDLYKNKKLADEISYHWDRLIQKTCQNAFDGKLLGDADLWKGRSAILEMAKEPRFVRRALSRRMFEAINNFPELLGPLVRQVTFLPSFHPGKAYVFLQLKVEIITDYENDYRPMRRAMLELACAAAKLKFDHLTSVVGIAIEAPKFSRTVSEDYLLLDCTEWPDHARARYEEANKEFKFFMTNAMTTHRERVTEFVATEKGTSGR